MVTYTDKQDFVGRKQRQRKPRDLVMDTREPDKITELTLSGAGYTVERRALKVGDFAWGLKPASYLTTRLSFNYIIVERKTLADLRDVDRLMSQVRRMQHMMMIDPAHEQTLCIILIEYRFDRDFKRKWSDHAIRNAKLSLQLAGVKIAECDDNGVADAIDTLYQWSNKTKHELIGGD